MPHDAFQKHPTHKSKMLSLSEWGEGGKHAKEYGEWADVHVVQRLWVSASLVAIEYWKARDKIVIGDIDDGFEHLPSTVTSYPYWRKGVVNMQHPDTGEVREFQLKYTPLEQIIWGSKLLHGITTPSKYLTKDWAKYNNGSRYLANYLDTKRYNVPREIVKDAPIILGWGGSMSHTDSWTRSGVYAALKRILKKYDNVKLMIAGDMRHVQYFKKQFGDRIIGVPWNKVNTWYKTLATFDIGLVPLHGGYDLRRSPLKAIEYCLMGIPFVGSNHDIYDEFTPYAVTVKNQPNHWERALSEMIENYHDIRHDSKWKEARELALSWDINDNLDNIVSVYEDIAQLDKIEERYHAS
jgi:hypothetical protein